MQFNCFRTKVPKHEIFITEFFLHIKVYQAVAELSVRFIFWGVQQCSVLVTILHGPNNYKDNKGRPFFKIDL
jgi:hypothetical protein